MSRKPAVSLIRCKVGARLLWQTNRKSHTRFGLVPKSMALDDLEWFVSVCICFRIPPQKLMKTDAQNQRRKCRRMNVVSKSTRFVAIFAGAP